MKENQLDKDKQAQGRKLFLIEGILASFATRRVLGRIITAFALTLGANAGQIGIINSVRRIASFSQLLTNHLLERIGGKRRLYYCVYGGSRTVRLLIAFLPSIPLALVSHSAIWWLVFMLFVIGCVDSIGIVLKKTWLSELTPPDIRGRYFGLRNVFIDASAMAAGYLSSLYVDHWKAVGRGMFGFQTVFAISAFLGSLSLVAVFMMPEVPSDAKKQNLRALLSSFQIPFRNRPFVVWTAFRGAYAFAMNFATPFFSVYLLRELQLPLATIAIYTAIGQIVSILLSRFWGTMADRYGNKTILAISCIAHSISPALWIFATGVGTLRAKIWLGFIHCARGFNSARRITTLNMALWLSPEESRPMYLACESTVWQLAAAVSPFLGGLLIGAIAGRCIEVSILGRNQTLCAIHILFLISAILRSAASLILIWVSSDSSARSD